MVIGGEILQSAGQVKRLRRAMIKPSWSEVMYIFVSDLRHKFGPRVTGWGFLRPAGLLGCMGYAPCHVGHRCGDNAYWGVTV